MGDLNLFGRVILLSDNSLNNNMNESLTKLRTTKHNGHWERLVNTDMDRINFYPSNFNDGRLKRNDKIPFLLLRKNIITISKYQ